MRSEARMGSRALDDPGWDVFEARAVDVVPDLHRLAAAIVGPDDAADVVQDALVEAWRHLRSLRDHERFAPWLRSIVINRCRNTLRTRTRRIRTTTLASTDAGLPDRRPDLTDAIALRDQLDRAFERLSLDHRAVLALRYTLDLPLAEIAQVLRVPEGTVKSRLHAAVERLRAAYEEDDR